jgi:hypothetical protein
MAFEMSARYLDSSMPLLKSVGTPRTIVSEEEETGSMVFIHVLKLISVSSFFNRLSTLGQMPEIDGFMMFPPRFSYVAVTIKKKNEHH